MKKKTSIIKKTNYFIVTQKSYPAETCKIVDLIIHYKEPGKEDVHIPMKDIETMKGVQYIKKEDIKKITKPLFDPLEFEFEHSYILFSQLQSAKVELGEDSCRELHIKLSSISAPLYDYVKTSPYYKSSVESLSLNAKAYYLYNLLAFYRYKTSFVLSIEEIKEYLQCTSGYYDSTSEFLKKIIRPAIAEIHEKTSMHVSYKKANFGHAINDLEFTVSDKTLELSPCFDIPESDIFDSSFDDSSEDSSGSDARICEHQWVSTEARVKDQINYDWLASQSSWKDDIERIDGFVTIMCEIIVSDAKTMRINRCDYPMSKIKDTFSKITADHIEYILEKMYSNSPDIRNQRSYLVTLLFNSVSEYENYITTQFGHDMYPDGRDPKRRNKAISMEPCTDVIKEDLREIIDKAMAKGLSANAKEGV